MQSAKAAVAAARLELSWTRITAPIAGRVDRILVTRGNLVSGGVAGNATLLTAIVSHNPMYVYFDIDEALAEGVTAYPLRQKSTGSQHGVNHR